MRQPLVWVSWLIVVLVVISVTRNPLYLVLVLLCILFVGISLRQAGAELPNPFPLWKFAGWIILLATLFNAFTSHYGTTVLFTIPGKIPLLSGNVTVEGMVYGAINGLVLTGMLASFSVLNLALPVRDLISLIPRAFFPMAVVASIAITYIPTTLRQFRQIREAQAVRGHQLHTLRDWLPLLMPLLVGGLEHAMQLAEAMTARGFACPKPIERNQQTIPRLFMLAGILMLGCGWIAQLANAGEVGLALILVGAGVILAGLWWVGRQSLRTSYHRRLWKWQDCLIIAIVIIVLSACILPFQALGNQTLDYEPYPSLQLPLFSPILGIILLGLLVPGLFVFNRSTEADLHLDKLKESAS